MKSIKSLLSFLFLAIFISTPVAFSKKTGETNKQKNIQHKLVTQHGNKKVRSQHGNKRAHTQHKSTRADENINITKRPTTQNN
ncbi:MAG: hypothetical protein EP298_03545 [Gammaproteobacteria bacterium]|nr:MAG: hypothetical protein EP298_03545 [Gammaproteobacteria bacterium]